MYSFCRRTSWFVGIFLRGLLAASLAVTLGFGATAPAAATIVPLAVPSASTALQDTLGDLGARPGATRVPVRISDQVSASVDVGTGNFMVQIAGLSLPGVTGDNTIGLTGNSLSQERSTSTGEPQRFELTAGAAGSLSTVSGGVIYEGPDGYSAKFTQVAGSTTAFTAPDGVKSDLVKTSTGYTLTSRTSGTVTEFNADGKTVSVADRNGNKTTYTYTNGVLSKVVGTRGTAEAKTATINVTSSAITVTQTANGGYDTRTVKFEKDSTNDLAAFVDAEGNRTLFETWSGQVRKITSPTGEVTNIFYDDQDRVTRVGKVNFDGANSRTRFEYTSATQTLVADPNTDQSQPVSAVPRTTYTLNSAQRVSAATDAMGRKVAKTYTPDFDTATATEGAGATSGTTTNTFGANDGESLTKSASPGGAAGQAEYGNTAANTKYLATSSTDDAGNKSLYTYNGAGNPLTSTDAMAAEAKLTYNADGTVATATAPDNGTNATRYTYDAYKQLTKVTPVTGTSLGVKDFTYDTWGRLATATDGRGNTIRYSYDKIDRMTKIDFSDATADVSYTYDGDGMLTKRMDGSGTTTWAYDNLGRLYERSSTAGGGTIKYGYDLASNLTSVTDTRGTTRYEFDASGTPTAMKYLLEGQEKTLKIATDDRGRRTDVWMDYQPDGSWWAAHTHTDYDKSGRVTRVKATQGHGTTAETVADITYCYAAGTTPTGGCDSTDAAKDRAKIQWTKNAADGSAMAYTYDKRGWLTKAVRTGGDRPYTYNYTYDARGNRKTANATGDYPAQNYTFNAANQLTNTGFAYDGAGNLTKDTKATFAYNAAGQMVSTTRSTGTYNYTYADADQQELVKQNTTRGNYEYVYGREDQFGNPVIEQIKYDGYIGYVERDPVTGEPLLLRTPSGMQSLYVFDGIGNPTALITNASYTATAYEYDPYGVPTLTENSGGWGTPVNPYQFKGGLHDRTTNWVKFGHRWYSVEWGRFSQQDTLDAPLDPANANRYAFAANDPINNADPTGQEVDEQCLKDSVKIGAGAGLAYGATKGAIAGGVTGAVAGVGVGAPIGALAGAVTGSLIGTLEGVATGVIGGLAVCQE
ncbi:RHS repeat-associated core domain-containing protein [Kocuria flava]|uniref:RHS repeat-associated core domain-containing protein n=1 Tax=Kocuria flava TaxID=446860 RepID=UPI002F94890F